MNKLSPARFGFGLAVGSALAYLGCVIVMVTVPHEVSVRFFNSLMHGVDVESIMRWDMPTWEAAIGIVEIFILGWLFGAVVAVFYNLGLTRE